MFPFEIVSISFRSDIPMALDSKVAFQARAIELGVTQADVTALETKGITSYATYAYCCTFQPGQVDDSALKDFLNDALGAAPDAASMSRYRAPVL